MIDNEKLFSSFKLNFTEKDIVKYNNNSYLSLDDNGTMLIRNFCSNEFFVDIDSYFHDNEIKQLNRNCFLNKNKLNSNLNIREYEHYSSCLILGSSDKSIRDDLNKHSFIIGINDSLKEYSDKISIYMNNNPDSHILNFLPNNPSRWPEGLFAYRTNPRFLSMYKGSQNGYNIPRNIKNDTLINVNSHNFYLEDHRSIILSVMNLIYILGITSVFLLKVENYITEEQPGTVYIKSGIYMYPQQIVNTSILSASIYWLTKQGVRVYTYDRNFDFIENLQIIKEEN